MADTPKYAQLITQLRALIAELPVGAPVPSERALAEQSGVSRMTARRALSALTAEGYLRRVVGQGSFVARPAVNLPLRLTGFSEDMRSRGLDPSSRVLDCRVDPADDDLAGVFDVPAGEDVLRIVRLRLADDLPIAIERVHLLAAAVPGIDRIDLATQSLYAVLERDYAIRFDAGRQTIRAGIAEPADAEVLGIAPGSAVLELVRTSAMQDRVIEHTVSTYPGDRFELSAQIAPATADAAGHSALRRRPR
ncbi:GntR family transcriptional regulator [Microbacterium sp.]|uniref:GntR family transcriptional regulator n=1 Tax=Microbacterium sp. TaxID=51671 RepID=UPI003A8A55CF